AGELSIDLFQVLHQDAPRDAVDHQVMEDQQQPVNARRTTCEQGGAEQRTAAEIEAGLQGAAAGFEGGRSIVLQQRRQVDLEERWRRLPADLHTAWTGDELDAEGVVMRGEMRERPAQAVRFQRYGRRQQQRLIVMFRVRQLRGEEAILD